MTATALYTREDPNKSSKIVSRKASVDDLLGQELGESYDAYRERWEAAARFNQRPKFPIMIDFELNYSCNLKCPMCTWSTEQTVPGKNSWMDFDLFKRIVEEGVPKGLASIGLDWINEPTIRKDLPKFIKFAHDAGVIDSIVHSNGTLLTSVFADELIESGLTRMMFSLDAVSKETYEKIRIGADFDKVIRNVHDFIDRRRRKGRRLPLVSVNFVLMSINEDELNAFLDYWEPHVDFFVVQQYMNPFENETAQDGRLFARSREVVPEFKCHQPWQRMTIRYDGRVLPCCSFYADQLVVGDVRHQSVEEIWNGMAMRQLQMMHARGEYFKNPVCLTCARNSVVNLTDEVLAQS
ncbi:MAG: hypothetical protein A3G87_05905 [Omnitrophica bacterium RIFCSPLOWO2_12_FULL_50_11]|nr:MAG: hypothetical protein A3G87_05905 [Omnitrophica bacterium RIFCSPLOWO2_12_FULL_50_11]